MTIIYLMKFADGERIKTSLMIYLL